ncbi:MAG: hypothetical protein AABY11_04090, partial [archaeon]
LKKKVKHDAKRLEKEKKSRTKGMKGKIRALVSWKAYRNLRELKTIRSANELNFVTSRFALKRLAELREHEMSRPLTQNEMKELFHLEVSEPRYRHAVEEYLHARKVRDERTVRRSPKSPSSSRTSAPK